MSCSTPFFIQSALLANVPCGESLVWFMPSGFWYAILTGTLNILADILCPPRASNFYTCMFYVGMLVDIVQGARKEPTRGRKMCGRGYGEEESW